MFEYRTTFRAFVIGFNSLNLCWLANNCIGAIFFFVITNILLHFFIHIN